MPFGQELLKLAVLAFHILEPFGIGCFHGAKSGPPIVKREIAEPALPAKVLDRYPCTDFSTTLD